MWRVRRGWPFERHTGVIELRVLPFTLLALAACGTAATAPMATEPSLDQPTTSPSTSLLVHDAPATTAPRSTVGTSDGDGHHDGAPIDPETIEWLALGDVPESMVLTQAVRRFAADCGPDDSCFATLPSAVASYSAVDAPDARGLLISQYLSMPSARADGEASGVGRSIGERFVEAAPPDRGGVVRLTWTEPNGMFVELNAFGFSDAELDAVVSAMAPVPPSDWPGAEIVDPFTTCVGDTTRFAPTAVPDGWVRYVLSAEAEDACTTGALLTMSLVVPGTASGPGTLVTFATTSRATSGTGGDPIEIGEWQGSIRAETMGDGREAYRATLDLDAVRVSGHGNVDRATLLELMASVRLLTEDEWAQLVAEIAGP